MHYWIKLWSVNSSLSYVISVSRCSQILKRCTSTSSKNDLNYIPDNLTVSFAAKYNSELVEKNKYQAWEDNRYFSPNISSNLNDERIFSMILPPPNITGSLHLGHAFTVTIQDVLCRWKRMQGYVTIWVPGTDHAGIATQVAVEKMIFANSGLYRRDMRVDAFLTEILKWKDIKREKIKDQLKQLGASLDWPREMFTMDVNHSKAVTEAVIRLYDDGLLFRKNTLVNWCCSLQSTISDIEIDYISIEPCMQVSLPGYDEPISFGELISLAYKVYGSDSEEVVISTSRIETIFGDVAIAVHPDDIRYKHLEGSYLWHPLRNCKIPLIFDSAIDQQFGTGAMKVTPAHSHLDFDLGMRHNLPSISVINESGFLNENCGEYALLNYALLGVIIMMVVHDRRALILYVPYGAILLPMAAARVDNNDCTSRIVSRWKGEYNLGMKRFSARAVLKEKLTKMGVIRGIENGAMQLPVCSRSRDAIEYIMKPQWFIRCKDMAQNAINIINSEELKIESEPRRNVWNEWHKNAQDWCISRQLWWGHRLPLYETTAGWIAARSSEEARQKAAAKLGVPVNNVDDPKQDDDVLDTWFSSGLLPFSCFGWPDTNNDLQSLYPLSLMVSGEDILCFWISRMVMLGMYFTGQVPFKNISLHGMICDTEGRKMSKSLGNVIDPENIINGITLQEMNKQVYANHKLGILSDKELEAALRLQKQMFPNGIPRCGIDALRYTLASYDAKDHVIHFNVNECVKSLQFCNKFWQASKFIIGWNNKFEIAQTDDINIVYSWHAWILSRLADAVENINHELSLFNVHGAVHAFRKFFHTEFCDVFIELCKPALRERNANSTVTCQILLHCLETSLRLISPIMPFIAEELYSYLPKHIMKGDPVMIAPFPSSQQYSKWRNKDLETEMQLVRDIVSAVRSLKISAKLLTKDSADIIIMNDLEDLLNTHVYSIKTLSRCASITVSKDIPNVPAIPIIVRNHILLYLLLPATENYVSLYNNAYSECVDKTHGKIKEIQEVINNLETKTSSESYILKAEDEMKINNENKIKYIESAPKSKEEADKAVKKIKGILEEIYEKQALLESTHAGVNDLLKEN